MINGIINAIGAASTSGSGTTPEPIFPGVLTPTETAAITKFVQAEINNNNWYKYDSFYCFSLSDPLNALFDWKRQVSATNNGATLDINGATFNGAEWVNSNYTPITDVINYKQDDAFAGIFFKDNASTVQDTYIFGTSKSLAGAAKLKAQPTSEGVRGSLNASGEINFNGSGFLSNSLYILNREVNNLTRIYINGVMSGGESTAISDGIPTTPYIIGNADSNSTGAIIGTISTFIAGAAIGFNQEIHYTNQRQLLIDLGVISGLSPEAEAMLDNYDTLGVALVGNERDMMIAYVDALVASGAYLLIDYDVILPLGATNGLVDWKGGKVATNNGATFDVNGATFNGSEWINSHYNISTDLVNASFDNLFITSFLKSNIPISLATLFGAANVGNSNTGSTIRNSLTSVSYGLNESAFSGGGSEGFIDNTLYGTSREGTTKTLFKNGVLVTSRPTNTDSISDINFSIGSININNGAAFRGITGTISNFLISAAIGFPQEQYNTDLRALLTGLGAI